MKFKFARPFLFLFVFYRLSPWEVRSTFIYNKGSPIYTFFACKSVYLQRIPLSQVEELVFNQIWFSLILNFYVFKFYFFY